MNLEPLDALDWGKRSGLSHAALEEAFIAMMLPGSPAQQAAVATLENVFDTSAADHELLAALVEIILSAAESHPKTDLSAVLRLLIRRLETPHVRQALWHARERMVADLSRGRPEIPVLLARLAPDVLFPFLATPPSTARTVALWCLSQDTEVPEVPMPTPIDRLIERLNEARRRELSATQCRDLFDRAKANFFSLHRTIDVAVPTFDDVITRLAQAHPQARWSALTGFLEDEQDAVLVDVLCSRMIETFIPADARSFADIPFEGRSLVVRALRSSQVFSQLQRRLKRLGLPYLRKAVEEQIGIHGLVETLVFLPEMYDDAVGRIELEGTPYWRGTPFIFFSGDTGLLDSQIVEDEKDYTPAVMDSSSRVAAYFFQNHILGAYPKLASYRYYPHETRDSLMQRMRANQWRVMLPDAPEPEPTFDGLCAALKAEGWQDVTAWRSGKPRLFASFRTDDGHIWFSIHGARTTLSLGHTSVTEASMIVLLGDPAEVVACLKPSRPGPRCFQDTFERARNMGLQMRIRLSPHTELQL